MCAELRRGCCALTAGLEPRRSPPSTMILWLCLCWGFSPAAAQPDSELMARYLEQQLLADYSIVQQVGLKGVCSGASGERGWFVPFFTSSADKRGRLIKMHLFHLSVLFSSVGGVAAGMGLC